MSIGRECAPRFLLAVDDAGEFLVAVGDTLRIGHLRAADVDLPFLADVPSHAAVLRLVEDFHAGARWCLAPEHGATLTVNARAIGTAGCALADGDEVRLARNLAFRFVAKERGTSAARLELAGGTECFGAPRVLLLPVGAGGRARIGNNAARTIPVGDVEHEIELAAQQTGPRASVAVRCVVGVAATVATGLRSVDPLGAVRPPDEPEVRLALPLTIQVTLVARARPLGQAPFALIFRPATTSLEG